MTLSQFLEPRRSSADADGTMQRRTGLIRRLSSSSNRHRCCTKHLLPAIKPTNWEDRSTSRKVVETVGAFLPSSHINRQEVREDLIKIPTGESEDVVIKAGAREKRQLIKRRKKRELNEPGEVEPRAAPVARYLPPATATSTYLLPLRLYLRTRTYDQMFNNILQSSTPGKARQNRKYEFTNGNRFLLFSATMPKWKTRCASFQPFCKVASHLFRTKQSITLYMVAVCSRCIT